MSELGNGRRTGVQHAYERNCASRIIRDRLLDSFALLSIGVAATCPNIG